MNKKKIITILSLIIGGILGLGICYILYSEFPLLWIWICGIVLGFCICRILLMRKIKKINKEISDDIVNLLERNHEAEGEEKMEILMYHGNVTGKMETIRRLLKI